MLRFLLLLCAWTACMPGQSSDLGYRDLPRWAREKLQAIQATVPEPEGADAWVIFERTEFAYRGEGEIRKRHHRIVKVNSDRASHQGVFSTYGLGKDTSVVTHLNGWHLEKNGRVTTVDQDYLVKVDADRRSTFSTDQVSVAVLPGVGAGSVVIWESDESLKSPIGPVATEFLLGAYPKAQFELEWTTGGWFSGGREAVPRMQLRHPEPWIKVPTGQRDNAISLANLPAMPAEWPGQPHAHNSLPWISISFLDPRLDTPPASTWSELGAWFGKAYEARLTPLVIKGLEGRGGKEGLEALAAWMRKELGYRQVYLSPIRGWLPVSAAETVRRRFGDCKDLSMVALAGARALGFQGVPAKSRVFEGHVEADEPVSSLAFNHVIAAIQLPRSFGYPAEVETPNGRYLLFDPTDSGTPLGWLPGAHRGRRVLICLLEEAAWVQVPEQATEPAEVSVNWNGAAEASGRVKGRLTIQERGDMFGLRQLQSEGSLLELRARVAALVGMPVDADWTIESSPVEGRAGVLEVRLDIDWPRGLVQEGGRWRFRPLGFNPLPVDLGQLGERTQQPLEWLSRGAFKYQGTTAFPWPIHGADMIEELCKGPFGQLKIGSSAAGRVLRSDWEVRQTDMIASREAAQDLVEASWAAQNEWVGLFRKACVVERIP